MATSGKDDSSMLAPGEQLPLSPRTDDVGYPRAEPAYFLTNQLNVLSVLSSGLLLPRRGFTKYYPDLLDLADPEIPVCIGFDETSVQAVTSVEDMPLYPVAVELPSESSESAVVRTGGWSALRGPVALSITPRLHFRSDHDRHEFEVRAYENIVFEPELITSPDLFDGSRASPELSALTRGKRTSKTPDPDDFELAERFAGAICLATLAAASSRDLVPVVSDLWAGTAHIVELDGQEVDLSSTVTALIKDVEGGESVAALILAVAMKSAAKIEPSEISGPSAWLNLVRDELTSVKPKRGDALAEIDHLLSVMKDVNSGDAAFDDIAPTLTETLACIGGTSLGLTSAAPPLMLEPGTIPFLIGSMLVGAAHGHRVLSRDLRSPTTEPLLAHLKIEVLRHRVGGRPLKPIHAKPSITVSGDGSMQLSAGGALILETAPDVTYVLRDPQRLKEFERPLLETITEYGLERYVSSEVRIPVGQPVNLEANADWLILRGAVGAEIVYSVEADALIAFLESEPAATSRDLSGSFAQRLAATRRAPSAT